jgi:hypothetical protein
MDCLAERLHSIQVALRKSSYVTWELFAVFGRRPLPIGNLLARGIMLNRLLNDVPSFRESTQHSAPFISHPNDVGS